MKGLKKMDEMEQYISLKSLKIAYVYTIIFLFIWVIIDYIVNKTASNTAFFLLLTQNLILTFSQLYFKKKMGGSL